jgi:hypothetical protein
MPLADPHPVVFWAGAVAFFGTGMAIAAFAAFRIVDGGGSVAAGMASGAFVGGYGAWFVFYVGHKLIKAAKRLLRSAGA